MYDIFSIKEMVEAYIKKSEDSITQLTKEIASLKFEATQNEKDIERKYKQINSFNQFIYFQKNALEEWEGYFSETRNR